MAAVFEMERERAMERLELESGLRHAMDDGELHLVYQPLVDTGGRVARFEKRFGKAASAKRRAVTS